MIDLTLLELGRNSKTLHRSCRPSVHSKENLSSRKDTFRAFVQQRRSFVPSKERVNYINLRNDMQKLIENLNKDQPFELNQFYQSKEKIMLEFLNYFVDDLRKENLDKAELFVTIWKNMFLLVEKCLEKVCKNCKQKEKFNLEEQVGTHKKYQNILGQYMQDRKQLQQEDQKKEKFMKILVVKIREYKKEIKKMEENLRMAAEKLNEFRNGFLQVQIQCINLTMELRNLGEESAKMMVNRKMALALQKSKQYKILKSKKKMRKEIKAEAIRSDSPDNIQIKQQCYDAFKSVLHQKAENIPKTVSRQIEAILDKEQSDPIDYQIFNGNLVQDKYLALDQKVDKQTDMQGFFIEMLDKKVGINPQQRFYSAMTKMRGVQTMPIEKIVIKTEQIGFQCEFKSIVSNKLMKKRVYDLSFLFENTAKSSNIKMRENTFLKSIKEIPIEKPKEKKKQKNNNKNRTQDFQIQSRVQLDTTSLNSEIEILINETNQTQKQATQNLQINENDEYDNNSLGNDLNNKKKLKKLSSNNTKIKNKVSFLSHQNNTNYHQQKIQSFKLLENEQPNIKSKDREEQKYHANNVLVVMEGRKSLKTQTLDKKNKENSFTITNTDHKNNKIINQEIIQKSLRNTFKSLKKYQSSDYKDIYKTPANNDDEDTSKPKKTIPSNSNNQRSQRYLTTSINPIKKDIKINIDQLYKDINIQIKKNKYNNNNSQIKNLHKIKQLHKNIQSALQIAFKDFQSHGSLKHMFYSVHQAIGNSYGLTNNSYIRKKLICFIKDIHQNKYDNNLFQLFLLIIGIDDQGDKNSQYSQLNSELVFKILRKISINWKIPIKIQQLKCDPQKILQNIQHELQNNRFKQSIIFSIIKNIEQAHLRTTSKNIDIIDITLTFIKTLLKKSSIIMNSYEPIISLLENKENEQLSIDFIDFIIQLQFFNNVDKKSVKNMLQGFIQNQQKQKNTKINRSNFAYFCIQNDILDFPRLLYKVLNLHKLKQNSYIIQQITNQTILKLSLEWLSVNIKNKIIQQYKQQNNNNSHNNSHNNNNNNNNSNNNILLHQIVKKNLLIIIYLKQKDYLSQLVLSNIVGSHIIQLTNLYSILTSESSSHLLY